MSTPSFSIAGRSIGPEFPPYVIAEISCNHAYAKEGPWGPAGKSYDRCVELVKQAAAAGCDAVKLQTYLADTITIKHDSKHFQITGAKVKLWNHQTLHSLYDENSTPWEWTEPLMKIANDLGMVLFTSPFDETAVDYLEAINVPAYKIASFENTDHGLLRKIALTGKPVIMSTGMASVADIDESVHVLRSINPDIQLAILKCTSAYPAECVFSELMVLLVAWLLCCCFVAVIFCHTHNRLLCFFSFLVYIFFRSHIPRNPISTVRPTLIFVASR